MITVYTDGGCLDNPAGVGAWACLLIDEDGKEELRSGSIPKPCSSNAAEMEAVIQALGRATKGVRVHIISDSAYVVNTMTKGWKRRANLDRWHRLDQCCQERRVSFEHVHGHRGIRGNELVDTAVTQELGRVKRGGASEVCYETRIILQSASAATLEQMVDVLQTQFARLKGPYEYDIGPIEAAPSRLAVVSP